MEWFEEKFKGEMKDLYIKVKEELRHSESIRCLDEETLVSYLENKLNAKEVEAVEEHLSLCSKCNEYVITLNKINSLNWNGTLPSPPKAALNKAVGLAARKEEQPPTKIVSHLPKALVEWGTEFFMRFRSPSFSFRFATATALVSLAAVLLFINVFHDQKPSGNALLRINAKVVVNRSPVKNTVYSFSGGDAADTLSKKIGIQDGGELKPGDDFQIVLQLKREAYICVLAQSDEERPLQLFPAPQSKQLKPFMTDIEYVIPTESQYFRVEEGVRKKKLYIMATKEPVLDTTTIARLLRAGGIEKVKEELESTIIAMRVLSFAIVDDSVLSK
jgi:hypothetical protein